MIDIFRDMWNDKWLGRPILLMLVALAVLIPAAIYADMKEQQRWDVFAKDHNCNVVAHMSGDVSVGFGTGVVSNGKLGTGTVVMTTPDKTAYKCDDGVTYWR